ncbi:MAG: iron-containing redox enzyme family protein [Drouetiella hepatica Uher 2000/2452]|jgi:pyrroloquinoline-quinone synthase|uniref:Iron-containing redox enzyme family protein n=1 Tax=Drouetiella hepatica Uher 2000/2452 TaxID=904376 RepID=A0A951Q9L1_9CYAN|nr:iron-containing redox enzyme family protein [Drouetiella hepatica Uher 2000/2452]
MNSLSSSVMQTFHEVTADHPLWSHEFLIRCQTSQLTLAEVQMLAVQMYKFSKEFNRILAGILSCCPDESAQLVILENLFDEMGQGDPKLAHPELFRHFTRELGIDDQTLAALPTEPETRHLIDTYLNLPHQYDYLAALGAVCFASEGIVSTLYTQIQNGIAEAAFLSKEALIFFDVHIDVDDSHAAKLAALIEPRITSTEVAMDVNRAILDAMNARVRFFDGILRQTSTLIYPTKSLQLLSV